MGSRNFSPDHEWFGLYEVGNTDSPTLADGQIALSTVLLHLISLSRIVPQMVSYVFGSDSDGDRRSTERT